MQREARATSSFTESKCRNQTTFALNRFDDFTFRQVRHTTQCSCRILTPKALGPKTNTNYPRMDLGPESVVVWCGVPFYFCDY